MLDGRKGEGWNSSYASLQLSCHPFMELRVGCMHSGKGSSARTCERPQCVNPTGWPWPWPWPWPWLWPHCFTPGPFCTGQVMGVGFPTLYVISSPPNLSKTKTTSEPEALTGPGTELWEQVCPMQREYRINFKKGLLRVLPTSQRKALQSRNSKKRRVERRLPSFRATHASTYGFWHMSAFLK